MDKKKSEENSVVQFNVVNTTSNTISLDLFNLATLNTTPTSLVYTNQPNSVIANTILPSITNQIIATNNGNLYLGLIPSTNLIDVYDTNNILITTINLGFSVNRGVYNPISNFIYYNDSTTKNIIVLNCFTNTVISIIPYPLITLSFFSGAVFNSTDNTIYYIDFATQTIYVLNCNTNTFVATILYPNPLANIQWDFNPNFNIIYASDNVSLVTQIIDCNSNTIVGTLSFVSIGSVFNYLNNFFYNFNVASGLLSLFNVITNTLTTQTISGSTGYSNSGFGVLDYDSNYIYYGSSGLNNQVFVIDANTNTFLTAINILPPTIGVTVIPTYNYFKKTVVFLAGSPFQLTEITPTGITSTTYYVSGAINYNFFVQSLQNEPIIVSKIRVIAPQQQLQTNANILQIDSSGEQSQYPVIPILTVSAFQEQGNIADIDFEELILDGRTFVSNYLIAPNTTVILEIHYQQLDNTKIKYLLTKIMPKKVQLKDEFDKYIDLSM